MTILTKEQIEAIKADTASMRQAVSGVHTEGTFHAANWADKPHRVLYDCIKHVDDLARTALDALARLAEAQTAQAMVVERTRCLQAIADLPTPENEDIMRGHEDAYRAVEALGPVTGMAEALELRTKVERLTALLRRAEDDYGDAAAGRTDMHCGWIEDVRKELGL